MSMGVGRLAALALGLVVSTSACADDPPRINSNPLPDGCAADFHGYQGLVDHLEAGFGDEPWADRVSVCPGGVIQLDQSGVEGADARRDEALAVCEAAAGYLITEPPPPERGGLPNPREGGVMVVNEESDPIALGAGDEIAAGATPETEVPGQEEVREPEPFDCFDPFAR
ncbi:MAG TPA: hypothetical protein VD926_05455 [Acidimicrobiales bacterium]|nr:hypothetical protein [Acidimicrobiales bacterium]